MEIKRNVKAQNSCRWCGWNLAGVIFIAFGISLLIFFPDFFHNQLLKNLELRPDSRTFSEWKKPTVPLYMDVYLFNWTNPDEIKNKSSKPMFQQLGPYRFREFPDKMNIKFNDANSTVSYQKFSSFFFDPDGSNGSLSDLCTTVNMVAVGAGNRAQNSNYFFQKALSFTLSSYKQKIHVTKSVEELLFEGYEDDMVTFSKSFENDTPFDRVGFLVKKNGTELPSGTYNVHTGVDDIYQLGSVRNFKNLPEFSFYEDECRKLKGSAGEFFSPEPSINQPLRLFTPEMCRSIPYDYEKDIQLHELKGHRFAAGLRAIDNGTLYDENKCYATNQSMPSGVMNISICNYGHPMFMSFPHFYEADSSYLEAVEGLAPDQETHQSYITLEPTTGITLEVTARFQTNILLRQYADYIPLFEDLPRVFMPLLWVEQRFIMDEENASQIRFALIIPCIGQAVGFALCAIGVILISVTYLKKLLCANINLPSKCEHGAVIKDFEANPLMTKTLSSL